MKLTGIICTWRGLLTALLVLADLSVGCQKNEGTQIFAGTGGAQGGDQGVDDASVPDSGTDDGGKPLGQPCVTADECDSGLCIDSVCCASTCTSCYSCNLPGKQGMCQPSPANTKSAECGDQKVPCGNDGTCDGQGGCSKPAAGQSCSPAVCQGAMLIPASACDGQGKCVPPTAVACAPFNCDTASGAHCRTTCAGPSDCAPNVSCNNNSCGLVLKKANGNGCVADDECLSNICADGVCCNAPCKGQCMACNQAGQVGNCRPVPNLKSDPHNICLNMGSASCGTNGVCDGSGGCLRYPLGTVCEIGRCMARTIIGAKTCDSSGKCSPTRNTDCDPYRCNPQTTACFTNCTLDRQCAVGLGRACKAGKCR